MFTLTNSEPVCCAWRISEYGNHLAHIFFLLPLPLLIRTLVVHDGFSVHCRCLFHMTTRGNKLLQQQCMVRISFGEYITIWGNLKSSICAFVISLGVHFVMFPSEHTFPQLYRNLLQVSASLCLHYQTLLIFLGD